MCVCVCVCVLQAREELRPVREDFEAKNQQLLDEMPKFYQSRIDYFQPSFEALIRAQVSGHSLARLHWETHTQRDSHALTHGHTHIGTQRAR